MTLTEDRDTRPRHGNFFVHRSAGIGSLGWFGSFILGGGVILSLLAMVFLGLFAMLGVLLLVGLVLCLLLFRDPRHGRNLGQRLANRVIFQRTVRRGTNELRSGPLSTLRYGQSRLPGIGAATDLSEHVDAWNEPFPLLATPSVDTVATMWSCDPPGSQLLDEEVIDQMVADYGGWLAGHTMEDGLIAASLTIQTRPDTGHRMRAGVEARRATTAPAVAVRAVEASLKQMSVGGARIQAWASATFTTKPVGDDRDDEDDLEEGAPPRERGRRKSVEEMARELAARAPLIGDALRAAGGGTITPTTGQELCEIVRGAYDPEMADVIDAAHAAGEPIPMNWTDVGPMAARGLWREYRHDSGTSVTWVMSRPPRGSVLSNILARLLAPNPAVDIQRVTLLYRPWDLGEAHERTDKDVQDAAWAVNNPTRGRASGTAKTMLDRAEATDREVAEGAGLLNFAVVVTGTVIDRKRLRQARAVIASLNKSAHLTMREAYGWQDTAFLYGLGIGFVPVLHAPLSQTVKERL